MTLTGASGHGKSGIPYQMVKQDKLLTENDFSGEWRFARAIADRLAGQALSAEGRAWLTPGGGGLTYREEAELLIPGQVPMRAERAYLWRFDGAEVEVRFDDGRPFHRFRPEGRGDGTAHPCGADLYRVTYDFTAWPAWQAVWTVTGPRKDYTSETRYWRAD